MGRSSTRHSRELFGHDCAGELAVQHGEKPNDDWFPEGFLGAQHFNGTSGTAFNIDLPVEWAGKTVLLFVGVQSPNDVYPPGGPSGWDTLHSWTLGNDWRGTLYSMDALDSSVVTMTPEGTQNYAILAFAVNKVDILESAMTGGDEVQYLAAPGLFISAGANYWITGNMVNNYGFDSSREGWPVNFDEDQYFGPTGFVSLSIAARTILTDSIIPAAWDGDEPTAYQISFIVGIKFQ